MPAAFLGLAFYWAWVAMVFYSHALIPGASLEHPGLESQLVDSIWLWATWSHMLGLLAVVAVGCRIGSLVSFAAGRVIGAVGVAAGTALVPVELTLVGVGDPLCQPVVLATTVVMGLASAWLVLQWAELYGWMRPSVVVAASTLSFALGLAIYFVLFAFPPLVGTVTSALLPLCSLLALLECRKRLVAEGASKPAPPRTGKVESAVSSLALALPIVSVFIFALCGEMLRAFSLSIAGASVDSMGAIYLVGGLVGLIALSAYVLVPKRAPAGGPPSSTRQFAIPLLRGVFLFMAAAFLVAPFLAGSALAVSYGIFGAGFWCFRAITWAVCFSLCRKRGVRPVVAIGVLDATYALSVVVGSSLNGWLTEALKVGTTEITTVSLIAVFALMFMALFVLNGPNVRALFDAEADVGAVENAEDVGGAAGAEGARGITVAEGAGVDPVAATIARLASARSLTPREAEVAVLLAKGRSLPFVQDELFISAGTAQTHARHIYKKLGVHSRQELIDLVERSGE